MKQFYPDIGSFFIALSKLKIVVILLLVTLIVGTTGFFLFYCPVFDPSFESTLSSSFFATVTLLLGLDIFNFPHDGNLIIKIIYTVLPITGTVLVGVGLIEFGLTVFTRNNRIIIWNEWKANRMKDHTVLIGLGNVGRRILQEFVSLGVDVSVITLEEEFSVLKVRDDPNVPLIIGDATQEEILSKVNIEKARAIVIATNDELANVKIASKAKSMNPDLRTVVRTYDHEFASKITEFFDIDTAYSTSAIAAPAFVAASFEDGVIQSLYRKEDNTRYHLIELTFSGSHLVSVGTLEEDYEITIIAINNVVHPQEENMIKSGDKVLLLADLDMIRVIKKKYCT